MCALNISISLDIFFLCILWAECAVYSHNTICPGRVAYSSPTAVSVYCPNINWDIVMELSI